MVCARPADRGVGPAPGSGPSRRLGRAEPNGSKRFIKCRTSWARACWARRFGYKRAWRGGGVGGRWGLLGPLPSSCPPEGTCPQKHWSCGQHAGGWGHGVRGRCGCGSSGEGAGPGSRRPGGGAQVWKKCWSTWLLRVPLVVSVWLTNSWVTCRVREPPASRPRGPRARPSAGREELRVPALLARSLSPRESLGPAAHPAGRARPSWCGWW